MTVTDLFLVFQWWIMLFIIGVLFFPLTSIIFSRFIDHGYIFGKILGICFVSYVIFLVGALHLVPFTQLTTLFFFLFIPLPFILTGIVLKRNIRSLLFSSWKNHKTLLIFEEVLFLVGLFFLSWVRSFSPDIHGLEKYMDFGFINSINRGDYFPPKDMWLPPFSINYYYFGHLVTAVLTKASGIPSFITYNLMLATIFAFCLTGSFSIGANLIAHLGRKSTFSLKAIIIPGLLISLLVTVAGNLHIIYTLFSPYPNESPLPPWRLSLQPLSFPNAYWYPNATRFIYNTIHEFPIYSWVVSDLHGHVLDIPFVLLTIAVLFSLFQKFQDTNHKSQITHKSQNTKYQKLGIWSLFENWNLPLGYLLLVSFLLAVMYMTNAWDGIIYFLLAIFVIAIILLTSPKPQSILKTLSNRYFVLRTSYFILLLAIGFFLFTSPFNFFFKPFVSGIGVLCAPKFLTDIGRIGPLLFEADHCQHSPWWQLLILYGFFYFFVISFLIFLRRTKQKAKEDTFVLILITLSTLLIIIPEFIYAKDIYPAHYRANTMFKLVFQSFIMLSITSGYIIIRIVRYTKATTTYHTKRTLMLLKIWLFITGVLLVLVFIYPFLAINSYYAGLQTLVGLDGLKYLKNSYPTDYEAIMWLKEIKGQPVILEAVGESYTDYARVSANTGLPTVLGWPVHEWLWRGQYDIPSPRIPEVQKLYESEHIEETKQLLKKYKVEYVFLGDLERQKYPTLKEEKWPKLGKRVFENGTTRIYRIFATLLQ